MPRLVPPCQRTLPDHTFTVQLFVLFVGRYAIYYPRDCATVTGLDARCSGFTRSGWVTYYRLSCRRRLIFQWDAPTDIF